MTAAAGDQGQKRKSLFIMVGDMSADRHVAKIIARLHEQAPDLDIWGIGGSEMAKQKFTPLRHLDDVAVVGIVESIKFIPLYAKLIKELVEQIAIRQADAVLLVDFGGFNLTLARAIRKRFPQLPILYFISPQIWGSRPWRIKTIAKTVTKMLVIFPFEEPLYQSHDVSARFVGHPLMATLTLKESLSLREQFCEALALDAKKFIVGVFPGSRKREVEMHMPVTMRAIEQLLQTRTDVQFVISAADDAVIEQIKTAAQGNHAQMPDKVRVVASDKNHDLMANADLAWAKSGTTTLEVAMFGTPMFIYYLANWISFCIFLVFKRVQRVGWPNLLAGETIIPELIQLDCREDLLVRYTNDLLDVPALRQEIRDRLMGLRSQLGQGEYTANCAAEILEAVNY